MLTSILLSFQSMKMAKDNVLVRKINGLETAGSLSLLFSDKTGTITEGRLSVVELITGNVTNSRNSNSSEESLAFDMVDEGDDLTLVCVLSIRDNVRKEAADAIKEVQNAGIQVVMVTGDRKETAVAIAKEAGLLRT